MIGPVCPPTCRLDAIQSASGTDGTDGVEGADCAGA